MPVLDNRERWTVPAVRLGVLTLGVCLLGLAGLAHAGDQNTTAYSRAVTVTSDPPGAVIWRKDGRDYTCTNILTPGTVELAFHGDNDVQQLRLRRFGYSGKNFDVRLTDEKLGAVLGQPNSKSFVIAGDAAPDLKQLNAALKKESEETLLIDPNVFRCAPFDLDSILLEKDKETGAFDLSVNIQLDRSFGGPAFKLASRAPNPQERHQKMGQAALEAGIAEVLARFHHLTAKFPEVKVITVPCFYSTTEAALDTEVTTALRTTYESVRVLGIDGNYHLEMRPKIQPYTLENTVVKARAAERAITFVMPAAQIPDTLDKKAITDAVLAVGKIVLAK